ncbi:TlpA disulfide reductase family protein [Phnomibacter sp.]|uniref:TlpA disulfide reductase family protein n=1 Tax=Phnomibacter sp. TaxID=2836217 RepID=UPI002FDE6E93
MPFKFSYKQSAAAVLLALGMYSCQQSTNTDLVVKGTFSNATGGKILLAELPYAAAQRIVVDSAYLIDSLGRFRLHTPMSQESVYQLFISNGPGLLFINDAPDIEIVADAKKPEQFSVSGSPASSSIQALYNSFEKAYTEWKTAEAAAIAADKPGKQNDSLRTATLQQRDKRYTALQQLFSSYIGKEPNATAQYFALGMAHRFLPGSQWQQLLKTAQDKHPQHPGLQLLEQRLVTANAPGTHLLNKPAPEIQLPDSSGKQVALSSLRGKWVLAYVWAGWDSSSRKQAIVLRKTQSALYKKNLVFLGLSIDKERSSWIEAIRQDSVPAIQLSDLQYWDSKVLRQLDIEKVPFTMLIDPTGVVKAVNIADSVFVNTVSSFVR